MAAGATATPSPRGIPKIHHDNDRPDEVGINSIVDAIDTLYGGLDYQQIVADFAVTAAAINDATSLTLFTFVAITFDGATPVWVEVYAPQVFSTVAAIDKVEFALYDSGTSLGIIGDVAVPAAAGGPGGAARVSRRFTPPAATKTYSIKVYHQSANANTIKAGLGNAANVFGPAWASIRKA